jgi:hypothetical protein
MAVWAVATDVIATAIGAACRSINRMRIAPLMLATVACVKQGPPDQPAPTAVVIRHPLRGGTREVRLEDLAKPVELSKDCDMVRVEDGAIAFRCLEAEVLIRFQCRDHRTGHPLEFLIGAEDYEITCK